MPRLTQLESRNLNTDGWKVNKSSPKSGLRRSNISLLAWKSRRFRRKAGNTMLCVSISLSTALSALERQIAMWNSFRLSRYDPHLHAELDDSQGRRGAPVVVASDDPDFADPLSIAIIDAKSLFDASASERSSGDCDRSALEIAIIQDSIARCCGRVRWLPHNLNPADSLTKLAGAHEKPMMDLLQTSQLRIQAEEIPKDFSGADVTCNS